MSIMNTAENVSRQYANEENLSARADLHEQYSTNKQGLIPWLFEQYQFTENCRILELGCGNGSQWKNQIENLPKGTQLVLSDFSDGMVSSVRQKYGVYENAKFG